mmetsp:Transcript_4877/g.7507  ORF Transcript_4877/g.7507 Transcript_4877/m.7507 type:complete len:95 (-) Transcript_4877:570-854(-)
MARDVYPIPMIPSKEKGAKALRFFNKHRGNKTKEVIPNKVLDRLAVIPAVVRSFWNVSAKIMLYAKMAAKVLKQTDTAGRTLDRSPTDLDHASR